MKVLVTGGLGFIGTNIVEAYLEKGYEVVVVDNVSTGKLDNKQPNVTLYQEDINTEKFLEIVEKEAPNVINHHAAQIDVQTSIQAPVTDAHINILGTVNVLEACRKFGCRLVYASSAAVYGNPKYLGIDEEHPVNPISSYGISKHTPEHYISVYHQLYGVEYTIFRYANIYGPRQDPKGEGGVISILVDAFLEGNEFKVFGDGEQTRDFVYVGDVVSANVLATEISTNDIYNIGTGIPVSLNQTIEVFKEALSKEISISYQEERKGDIKHSYLLSDKAKAVLGWNPEVQLKEGIVKTYQYYNK